MQAMITEKHLVKLMTKDELLDLKRMLMINALVRFNLIPPIGSDAWNLRGVAYECMGIHFLPTPQFNDVNETLVMQLLGEASSARTPQDKLSLYGKLAEVTGYSLMQLACPVLHKEFYDKIPEFYLLDADNYQPPWTTNVLSAVLCLDLQRKLDDSASLSCLFALAALLERKDVITRLSAFNINENKMPIKTKELFVQFASYDKNEQLSVASPQFL